MVARLEQVRFLTHCFISGVAGDFRKGPIDPQDRAPGIGDHNAVGGFEGDGSNALTFGQGLMRGIQIPTYSGSNNEYQQGDCRKHEYRAQGVNNCWVGSCQPGNQLRV